ncbi:MAG: DEAD/DEAH box helicase, partial [Thiovulaceae bacterium]|nr:DEAD/DEAH box helicase [Sulfurimonadaceae bacterium]
MSLLEEKPLLDKLGCDNLIELALLVPGHFDDHTLYPTIQKGQKQALHVKVINRQTSGKNLKIELHCFNLNTNLHAMIFHPKPFHFSTFSPNKELYIFGVIEQGAWGLSMAQPLKIGNIGDIIPNYGSKIRNDSHQRIVREYLSVEGLVAEGLPAEVASLLVQVHHLDKDRLLGFNKEGVNFEELQALKFAEVYNYMKKLSKKKYTFPSMTQKVISAQPWVETLPFTLTQDQQKSIREIHDDMQKTQSAKRMIVGDVGSGKTMVILATAFMNSKGKTVLMAPTTLLAIQLFEEAQKWLPTLKSVLITNKEGKKAHLKEYDFLIGTHALLYKDLPHANVVMIDEQHRFGTKQRNLIEKMVAKEEKRAHFFKFSDNP